MIMIRKRLLPGCQLVEAAAQPGAPGLDRETLSSPAIPLAVRLLDPVDPIQVHDIARTIHSVALRASAAKLVTFPGFCPRHGPDALLVELVIGRFLRDDDIVDVGFLEARLGDLHEAGPFLEGGDVLAAAIPHAGAKTADQLGHQGRDAALVRHAPFDAFRYELFFFHLGLHITVLASLAHRADRPHAAISLEGAPLVQDGLARRFLGAGEQAADHHAGGAGRDRLGDVARILDAAVRDDRDVLLAGRLV